MTELRVAMFCCKHFTSEFGKEYIFKASKSVTMNSALFQSRLRVISGLDGEASEIFPHMA